MAGEATLTLRGDEKGTVITGNRGLYTTDHEEAGAGIVLAEGATLDLAGNVSVANNYERYLNPAGEDELFARNIYLLGNDNIVISGPITSGSQEHRTIGFSYRVPVVDKITRFGSFGSAYEAELNLNQQDVDMEELLGAIQLDGNALYFLEYEAGELYWTMNQEELPEAGIFRGEYILLLLGLAGLLLRNAKNVKERELVVTYLTALSIVSVALGAGIGVAHFRMDIAAYKASTLAVSQMEYDYNLAGATADETSLLVTQGGQDSTQLGTQQFRLNVPDDGRTYVGIVEVEECGIKLPVLASYTDADLKTTPCVYTGDALTDDLVIVGHNYDSQFASLNDIDGDVHVILTLMDGTVIHYESFAKEALDPSEIDEMIHGDWDLTLFTCSYSGEKRIAIRCDRKD